MNLNKWGLPATLQPDGTLDSNDTLQRVGMIAVGVELGGDEMLIGYANQIQPWTVADLGVIALLTDLQPSPGIYTRYPGAATNDVSADQLIAVLAYWIVSGNVKQALWMFLRMVCRLGFAQNYKDGLNAEAKTKIPDFMALRSLPFFARTHACLYPLCLALDVVLLFASLAAVGPVWRDGAGFTKRSPDDVDDNTLIITLAVCRARMVTPLSWLACKLYAKFRPWNLGCCEKYELSYNMFQSGFPVLTEPHKYSPVYGSLRWYHRAPAGNPQIADLYKPIVERYLT